MAGKTRESPGGVRLQGKKRKKPAKNIKQGGSKGGGPPSFELGKNRGGKNQEKKKNTKKEGAGHGFMRLGEDPGDKTPENKKAHNEGWARWKDILKKI